MDYNLRVLVGDYKTYVTYHVFCLFFIPILPLGCFRVIKENGGYRILGGERMAWREILCIFLGLIKWPFAIFAILRAHPTNPVEEGIRMLTQKLSLYDT